MPPRSPVTTTIDLSGPFFKHDPAKTFRQNVRVMMDALAAEGEADVQEQMGQAGPEGAAVRPYVVGRTRSLGGKRWAVSATVSVQPANLSRAGALRIMAIAAGRHKATTSSGRNIGTTLGVEGKHHVFRRTTSRLRRARAINAAELLKGLT